MPSRASKRKTPRFALYHRMGFKKVTEFDVYIIGLSGPIRRTDGYCRNDVARLSRLSCNPSKAVWITNREWRRCLPLTRLPLDAHQLVVGEQISRLAGWTFIVAEWRDATYSTFGLELIGRVGAPAADTDVKPWCFVDWLALLA